MAQPLVIRGPLEAIEAHLVRQVGETKRRDPLEPVVILVGSTLLRPYLRRVLVRRLGGVANLQLLTMNDLGAALGRATLIREGRAPLPPLGDRLIAEELATSASGYFAPVAGTPGFTQTLHRSLQELRQSALTPGIVRLAGETGGEARNAEKLTLLAKLYEQSLRRRESFFNGEDCVVAADPARFAARELLIYGVWQLSPIERQMIGLLIERVPVTVYLSEAGTEANEAHAALREWLREHGARQESLRVNDHSGSALAALQGTLFGPDPAPQPADRSVRLLSAPDPAREVAEAARACLDWAAEGIPFYEMAVTFRQTETYLGLIDEIFQGAGIPTYLHDGRPLASRPLGQSLLALTSLASSRLRRSAVMEFLTEAPLPIETIERYGGVEPAAWDALSREARIVEGRQQWRDRLRQLALAKRRSRLGDADGDESEPDEQLARQLAEIERFTQFIDDLAEHLGRHPAEGSWQVHLDYLRGLAAVYIDGSGPVIDQLAQLSEASPLVETVSFGRFQHAVRAALEGMDSQRLLGEPRGAFGRQGVNVLDVNSLRHLRFRTVVVLGLAERSFPPPRRQDPLLLDHEREAINRLAGDRLPLRAAGPDPEPLQFALAVAAARERLLLSFARTDAGSTRPNLPSHFFREAARALTGRPISIGEIDRLDPALFTRVPAGRFGAACPDAALTALEYERTLVADRQVLGKHYLAARYPAFARAQSAWAARWQDQRITAWDGLLGATAQPGVVRRSRIEQAISATRLETYATCPYRFFITTLLRVEPVEEPEMIERIAALDRGSLIHDVLDEFLSRCGPNDPPSSAREAVHRAWLREIAERACQEREDQGLVGYPLIWRFDKSAIIEDLEAWYTVEASENARGRLRPGAFEVRFGPPWTGMSDSGYSVDEPLTLRLGDGEGTGTAQTALELRFQGRIDRVDWSDDRSSMRVIDYKSGRADNYKEDRLRQGKTLQLPIYLLGAAHALRQHGIEIDWRHGEAEYFFVTRRGGFKRVRFHGATLESRWEEFQRLLASFAERLGSGDFHPEPGPGGEHCRYCPCRPACDSRIVRIADRKAASRHPAFAWLAEVE